MDSQAATLASFVAIFLADALSNTEIGGIGVTRRDAKDTNNQLAGDRHYPRRKASMRGNAWQYDSHLSLIAIGP